MPELKLSVGMYGDEVELLHSKLSQHGFDIPAAEVDRRFFGPATREAVLECQKEHGLKASGVVDEETNAAIDEAVAARKDQPTDVAAGADGQPATPAKPPASQPVTPTYPPPEENPTSKPLGGQDGQGRPKGFTVRGRVARSDGSALAALRVVAVERRPYSEGAHGEKILGTVQTDERGYYAIHYTADKLTNPAKGSADLMVRVYGENSREPLASSPLILNALEDEVINLSIGEEPYRGRSEYQVVAERLHSLLGQATDFDLSTQDVAYFSNQTGLTLEQVQLYAESRKQARKAKLDAAILYALYRTGMPYSLAALTVQSPEAIDANLKRAQEKNIIAPLDQGSVGEAVESLQELSVGVLLDDDSPSRVQAAELLELGDLQAEEKAAVLKAYAASSGLSEEFWDDFQESGALSEEKFETVRRVFEFNAVSLEHLPLVEKLTARREIGSVKDLASKDVQGWKEFLQREGVAAPDRVPGDSAVAKQDNYALILARIVEDAVPTASFSSGWTQDRSLDGDVARFFEDNPHYAFESKGINTYLKERPEALDGVQDKNAATFKLQALQNLYRISPRFERLNVVKPLWQDGVHSAHAIKRMGEEKFVATYEDTIGTAQARLAYARAEKVAGFTLMALAKYAWGTNGVTPYVIPKSDLAAQESETGSATLAELFGNLDFCHCEHCRSVLGPAAYLVDLLMFLDNATAKNGDTGLEKLFARRPDIGNIKLNCENTDTPLPYIDLVNEVLEDTIEPRFAYTPETHPVNDHETTVFESPPEGGVYQTDEKRPELLQANPEHINRAAYDKLKPANYPWTLPLNLWAEEARVYLAQLGVKRHELMEVFSGSGASSPTDTEVLCEALGLFLPEEFALFTTTVSDETQLKNLWGVKTGSLTDELKKVAVFLDRAKIEYPQLEALVQCRIIKPADSDGAIQISFDEDNPCSLDHAELTDLTPQKLDLLHRFIRLRHKLGWSFFDLDKALRAFGKTTIDDDLLKKLSLTTMLKERLNVGLLTALSWWSAKLDTVEYEDTPSQYADLFHNRAVGELKDEVRDTLKLNTAGDELSSIDKALTDPDYEPVVLGAAGIRKDDLALIIAEDLGNDALNLAHLSHVVRVASFSRAVELSVGEYYVLRTLTGIRPLSAPQHTAEPRDTKAFLEARQTVAESGLSLAELAYLLAHDTARPNNGQLSGQVIAQRLTEIRADLAAIRAAYQIPAPEEGLDTVLATKLGEVLEDEGTRIGALQIVLGQSPLSEAEQKTFIDDHFGAFVDTADAKDKLVGPVNALGSNVEARLRYMLEPLLAYLMPLQGRRYLEQKLSESLSFSVEAASALLDVVKNPSDSSQSAQGVFLEEAFVTGSDPIDAAVHAPQFGVYERIYKASRLLSALKPSSTDQAFIISQGPAMDWPDANALPLAPLASESELAALFERLATMVKAYQVGPRILTSGATLAEFLSEARMPGKTEAEIKQLLADSTAWSPDDIETLTTNYGYTLADLQKSVWLVRLYEAFSILKRLGVRAAQAWAWNTAEVTFDQAAQIKFAVKSKYDNQEWLSIAPALRDPLREKQRDALLAYVIHDKDFEDADDAYAYLLIDPQMSTCMDTSRIRQAISSVQLFVQRILLNLENRESEEIEFTHAEAKQWKWRKNYRIWEANRKVFLWPENWIYPDLRDDKSPFFNALEDELYQADIDNDSAERALMSYLKKLDEVANLEVSGLYEDTEQKLLHVVARTRSTPHKYFYRRWVNKQLWTAWEPVEADIEGDHLIPVVHNRRLFLFWPKFIEKSVQPSGKSMAIRPDDPSFTPDDPDKYYEILMAWTQYRDGKWRETQVSTDFFDTTPFQSLRPKEEFYFFAEQTPEGELWLRKRLVKVVPVEWGPYPDPPTILRYNDVTDTVKARPKGTPSSLEEERRNRRLNKLPDGDNAYMAFEKWREEEKLTLLSYADVDPEGTIEPSTQRTETILTSAESGFQLMLPQQYPTYTSQAPFFYSDSARVFFVEPRNAFWRPGFPPVGDAFNLSSEAYFANATANVFEHSLLTVAEQPGLLEAPRASGDLPFFDSDRAYYGGNKASEMVIDRARTASPGYEGVSRADGAGTMIAANGSAGLASIDATIVRHLLAERADEAVYADAISEIRQGTDRGHLYDNLGYLGWIHLVLGKKYHFQAFYLPHVPLMIKQVNRYGVEGLLAPTPDHGSDWYKLKRQQASYDYFGTAYAPDAVAVDLDHPKEDFDFSAGGAYSQYNWELFFHAPLLIAERLMQNQRFEDAQRWFHYVFDPTADVTLGLSATYFDNQNLTGPPNIMRVDSTLDFDWVTGSPDPAIGPDTFSVRWTGKVEPEHTETYTFHTRTDDGVRLWVNGHQLIDKWVNQAPTEHSGTIDLEAGKVYDIKMEYYENTGGAVAQLMWSSPSTPKAIIPQSRLYAEAAFDAPARFWKFKPFHDYNEETSIAKLLELLNEGDAEAEAQVEAWENDPFNPHLIARMRTVAYMRTLVMKYLDNLIGWGDSLFRQDTIESINEATQIYVLAAQILGREPERIEKTDVSAFTFNELFPFDGFSNARVSFESSLPWMTTHSSEPSSGASGVLDTLYFCIPENEKLLGYWDTVADRLFKIRNCMNIEGVRRQLALFEPPIDPGLLVKAGTGALDLSSVLSDLSAPLPFYRFRVMLQRAHEFCADVRALGAALLQALEKRDAEELSLIRATNQVDLLKSLRRIKEKAIDETIHSREALLERKRIAEIRHDHYSSLDKMNPLEITGVSLSSLSIASHMGAVAADTLAGAMFLIPNFRVGTSGFGGTPHVTADAPKLPEAGVRGANGMYQLAAILGESASLVHTIAGYVRRQEEWDLQSDIANKEIDDLEKQILAAGVRTEIAKNDLISNDLQIRHAETEADFLENRFTSNELYNWMVTQVSTLYFQMYQMAYDLAKRAEQAFRHELGISNTDYIQSGYWDSLKKGLLAGERLQKDLRRLEAAYLEMNRREFELAKHISLVQLDPVALLQLKQTGECEFAVPEVIFDLDHPGHYMRRIKAVSLSIPCVVGPYTSVSAKLTMLENRIRISTDLDPQGNYAYTGLSDSRFAHDLVGSQSIATSAGQQDAGLFELSFGDERYLPFEGGGVVGRWRLELPEEFRQFDYDTISDAVLHVRYTARDGGDSLKTAVQGELRQSLNKIADILAASETGITRIISAAHEFGTEWHRFIHPSADANSQELVLKLDKRLFPFMFEERRLKVGEIRAIFILDDAALYSGGGKLAITLMHHDGSITDDLEPFTAMGDQPSLSVSTSFPLEQEPEEIAVTIEETNLSAIAPALVEMRNGKRRLNPARIEDVLFALNYTVGG